MVNQSTIILGATLILVGCSELTAPPAPGTTDVPVATDIATTTNANPIAPQGTLAHVSDAPPLETYCTSFPVVQGRITNFRIHYLDPSNPDSTTEWFARIAIPADAQFVNENGLPVAEGDTVNVTVAIDSTHFFVRFGPHGSQFAGKKTADLTFNLKYADLGERDLNNVKVWYQPPVDHEWSMEPTDIDIGRMNVSIHLRHFSNYAVAW